MDPASLIAIRRRQAVIGGQAKRTIGKPTRILYPAGIERDYARLLRRMVRALFADIDRVITRRLADWVDRTDADRFDGMAEDLQGAAAGLRTNWEKDAAKQTGRVVDTARRINDHNKDQISQQMRAALGVDAFDGEPWLAGKMGDWTKTNVALIKDIGEQAIDRVTTLVSDGVRGGLRVERLSIQIREELMITDRRAILIARDQVGKFQGGLTEARHRARGIKDYKWRTVGDKRVRKSHEAREGQRFSYDDPPPDGNPGQPVQCRCWPEPIMDLFADLDDIPVGGTPFPKPAAPTGPAPKPIKPKKPPINVNPPPAPIVQTPPAANVPKQTLNVNPKPASPGPQGVPVSNALSFDPMAKKKVVDATQRTMRLIDGLHGDGQLPSIPITSTQARKEQGAYLSGLYNGRAHSIRLSTLGDHIELTAAHEIGHFIDHQGIHFGRMSSETHPDLDDFRKAVRSSQAIQSMQAIRGQYRTDIVGQDGVSKTVRVKPAHIGYLLKMEEIWARAYSQWVALRSGDATMLAQVAKVVAEASPYRYQWADDDFRPIAETIDRFMEKRGWRTKS